MVRNPNFTGSGDKRTEVLRQPQEKAVSTNKLGVLVCTCIPSTQEM
jgi:hypothetical protein